jgi:hypothetical protein
MLTHTPHEVACLLALAFLNHTPHPISAVLTLPTCFLGIILPHSGEANDLDQR